MDWKQNSIAVDFVEYPMKELLRVIPAAGDVMRGRINMNEWFNKRCE